MNSRETFKILNIAAVVVTIAINLLANLLPFNNQTTGAIAERFSTYFLPAGYVFSIWGLIYIGLILFAIFQARQDEQENPRLRKADIPFLLSCVGNVGWLFLWHYNFYVLSMLPILLLLGSLIAVYIAFEIGLRPVLRAEQWMAHAPFSLYLGWASVAVISNASAVLDYLGWNGGLSESTWAIIMLAVATLLGLVMAVFRRDAIFNLVLVWAFIGIAIRYSAEPAVAASAWAAAGVAGLWVILAVLRLQSATARATL
jgi:translocator protein